MDRINDIVSEVLERNPNRVFVQIPEGLRTRLTELQDRLEEEGIGSIASLEPCYGACDLKDIEARELGCDLLLHIGHTKFCEEEEVETLYFPWYYDRNPVPVLEEEREKLEEFKSIGLVASANFLPSLEDAKRYLESEGFEIHTASGERTEEGQVLGCDVSGALEVEDEIECYLYIGSGKFHPLGLALRTERPVLRFDFEQGEIMELDTDLFERQRIAAVEKARGLEDFGILLSTKKGQRRLELAEEIKGRLEDKGKSAYLFSMDEITPDKVEGTSVDCLVNTACPRVAMENRTNFKVPILNPSELEQAL
ncbi:MAG: diphthamide biosynthesis enzyme Dph2 [Candidatus Aenigmatarchaeota archaeon]